MPEHRSDTYRSRISRAIEGQKTRLSRHGGAVVAHLASLGPFFQGPRLAPHVWGPGGSCVVGVGFSAFAFAGSSALPFALDHASVVATPENGPRPMICRWGTVGVTVGFTACAVGAVAPGPHHRAPNTYEAPGCQETNYPLSGFFLFFRLPGLA
jgi:hypothetical protein